MRRLNEMLYKVPFFFFCESKWHVSQTLLKIHPRNFTCYQCDSVLEGFYLCLALLKYSLCSSQSSSQQKAKNDWGLEFLGRLSPSLPSSLLPGTDCQASSMFHRCWQVECSKINFKKGGGLNYSIPPTSHITKSISENQKFFYNGWS